MLSLTTLAVDQWVGLQGHDHQFTQVESLPKRQVGLVLGTSKYTRRGKTNQYYEGRIEAAARLFHAGKVEYLLVSGDHSSDYYNEPLQMQQDLQALGVPEARIVLDYAGFRTFDSVIRAWKVFGQQRFTIVSQGFHVNRALYIARHFDLDVAGFASPGLSDRTNWYMLVREKLARMKMMLDLYIFKAEPRYLGDRVAFR